MTLVEEALCRIENYEKNLHEFMNHVKQHHANINDNGHTADGGEDYLMTSFDKVLSIDKAFAESMKNIKKAIDIEEKYIGLLAQKEERERRLEEMKDLFFERIITLKKNLNEQQNKIKRLERLLEEDDFNEEALLALSERITLSSRAPPSWNLSDQLILHRPPHPTEDLMRCSLLFQVMNAGILLGEQTSTITQLQTHDTIQSPSLQEKDSFAHMAPTETHLSSDLFDLDLNPDAY